MNPDRWYILFAVMLAFVPVVVDMTILHIAIPSLTLALNASGNEVLWIIDIYPLVMAGLLVPMGTLADRIGYRRMLLIGLAVFTVSSVAAAFSPAAIPLIAARAALGIGSSMIMPCVLALIRQSFDDDAERATALGVWSVVGMAGAAVGPLAGGLLLEHFWWGAAFLVNVPIMMIVIPMAWRLVPETSGASSGPWDPRQALLLVAALMLTIYGIKAGFKSGLDLFAVAPFAIGLVLIVWFARLQIRSVSPMLDIALLKNPVIAAGLLMAFVASGALAGFELVLAQELQFVLGKTPLEAGVFMLPLVVAAAIGGPVGGKLATWFGLRPVATLSMLAASVSLAGLSFTNLADDHYLTVPALLAVLGFALGVGLLASSVAIMGGAPKEKAGAAGALESTGYELGAGIGVTIFGVMVNSLYRASFALDAAHPGASNSIGEAMTLAHKLGGDDGSKIVAAAKTAFVGAHGSVLLSVAIVIGLLALAVFAALRNAPSAAEHS